jgi:hypothetical protein
MGLNDIRLKFQEIKNLGYVKSMRGGPTGIGFTLETLLNLQESNLQLPDFDLIEIKSKRRNVNNLITLFTFNKGSWILKLSEIIQRFGYLDPNGRAALYSSVVNVPNNQGLFLNVNGDNLELIHEPETKIGIWDLRKIIDRFKAKMPALILVYADTRKNLKNEEEFYYSEAYILSVPTQIGMVSLINEGKLILDIRMHIKENGQVRNHGTAFRLYENNLPKCYLMKDRIM